MLKILVVDAQGGGIGKQVVCALKKEFDKIQITAIGTNSIATSSMLKAGADYAATGENPVVVCSKTADIIIGPIGIVIADSMLGEVNEKMAVAIGKSRARKILIPVNHCENIVAGVDDLSVGKLIASVVLEVRTYLEKKVDK